MAITFNAVLIVLLWLMSGAENWLTLKVTKTAYIKSLSKLFRWFIVAPLWTWISTGIVCLISTAAFLYVADAYGILGRVLLTVILVTKAFSIYRGLLVYTREHNLKYVQARKKQQGLPVTARDRIKDFAVRVTPQRWER